jgi:hypothetical protein
MKTEILEIILENFKDVASGIVILLVYFGNRNKKSIK